MKTYFLKLINNDTNLDLIQKTTQINNCLVEITNMRKGLTNFKVNNIHKNSLELIVDEKDKWWHQTFGKLLANEYGMRQFCSQWESSKMFIWS